MDRIVYTTTTPANDRWTAGRILAAARRADAHDALWADCEENEEA